MAWFSWLLAFEFLQFGLAEILRLILGVKVEKQDAVVVGDPIVDHSCAASFAMTLGGSAEFAAATGAGNHIACIRLLHQIHLDREDSVVTDQAEGFSVNSGPFLKGHGRTLRENLRTARSNTEYDMETKAGDQDPVALLAAARPSAACQIICKRALFSSRAFLLRFIIIEAGSVILKK